MIIDQSKIKEAVVKIVDEGLPCDMCKFLKGFFETSPLACDSCCSDSDFSGFELDSRFDTSAPEQTLYKKALERWGPVSQIDIAIEELGELIVELSHAKRGRPHKVEEEAADVSIVLPQVLLIFDKDKSALIRTQKLKRLEALLGKDENAKI